MKDGCLDGKIVAAAQVECRDDQAMQESSLQLTESAFVEEDAAKRKLKSWGRMISIRTSSAQLLDAHSATEVQPNSAKGNDLERLNQSIWMQSDVVFDVRSQGESGHSQLASNTDTHTGSYTHDRTKVSAEQRICVRSRSCRQREVYFVDPQVKSEAIGR
jgi:hypothetical protein